MKKIFTIIAVVLAVHHAHAQPLKTGDKLRDAALGKVLHYNKDKRKLSDYAGKPTLIHFWNLHCPLAMEAFDNLRKIMKRYGSEMHIIAVTSEKEERVAAFLAEYPYASQLGFAFVVEDSNVRKMFPHRVQPHEVWIDKHGVVQAISEDVHLNVENAARFVSGEGFTLPLKAEPTDLNLQKPEPLMNVLYPLHREVVRQYSFIGEAVMGASSNLSTPSAPRDGFMKLKAVNASVHNLYSMAYRVRNLHPSRLMMKESDKERFSVPNRSYKNTYCYELMMRTDSAVLAYEAMRRDLDAFFGVKSRYEKRKIKCLVLRRSSEADKIRSQATFTKEYNTDSTRVISNLPMGYFASGVLWRLPMYVIDETGYTGNVTIELPLDYTDVEAVRKALAKYDLSLTEEERELEVIALD